MQRDVKFQMEEVSEIPDWADAYPEHKFTVYKCCFLSTKPNSHELKITDEILREYAGTILGNFLVAKVQFGDAMSHESDEIIYGYFPREQEIEFVDANGITKAYAYAVVSKRYSKEFNGIFEFDNIRNSSVEMAVTTTDEDKDEVVSFDIYALTCLGRSVNGSCPDADIKMVRFTAEEADAYFSHTDALSNLKQFVEERKKSMADKKSYKVDKSKEAMSEKDWGDVDKAAMRDKIMDAANRAKLVKDVYMLVEDGWEDAPSEHLKYPVMILEGDTFVYNRYALSSAMAYAKQNGEDAVVNKVEKIYKKLGLTDSEGKEENMAMEIEFSAVDIGDLWSRLWAIIDETRHWEYSISGIYEEDNKKFAILIDRDKKLYKLDFSLTEDGMTVADEVVEVKQEFTDTDNVKKFAEPENVAEYRFSDDDGCEEHKDDEPDMEDMKAKLAKLEADIAERDNIIMDKDAELEELRKFKAEVEEQRKAAMVESIMAECKEYMSAEQFAKTREEGMACKPEELDAWSNRAKAVCFSAVKKSAKKALVETDVWGFAAPINPNKSNGLWD